jgi:aminoacyl tRNA synthase complex-interacting multifunctional protein 1
MATAAAPESSLLSLLYRSYPAAISPDATELDYVHASPKIFPEVNFGETENADIKQWLSTVSGLNTALSKDDKPVVESILTQLNSHLASRTTLLGAKPSVADVAVYALLAPIVEKWSPEERTGEKGYHHIVRHVDFVQNSRVFSLQIPDEEKVNIDVNDVKFVPKPIDPKEEKERKKREKAAQNPEAAPAPAAAAAEKPLVVGQGKPEKEAANAAPAGAKTEKKEKKEKKPKAPKPAPAPAAPPSPSLIDLRVGHILRAINHPNADSLYVSTIDCGDAPGSDNTSLDEETGKTVRTVCSGLNGLIPLAEMQGRKIVAVCNLKPVTMRGIKSAAMVLAASPKNDESHAGPVELVNPPADAPAGERIYFQGWSEGEPEKQLNPKKKVWETFQPGFTTTQDLEVAFDSSAVPVAKEQEGKPAIGKLVTASGVVCTVKSLKDATVR